MRTITLEDYEAEIVLGLVREYRSGVEDESISGYGQTKTQELHDVDSIIAAFEDRR